GAVDGAAKRVGGVLAGVAQGQRVGAERDGAVAGQADDRSAAVGQPGNIEGAVIGDVGAGADRAGAGERQRAAIDGGGAAVAVIAGQRLEAGGQRQSAGAVDGAAKRVGGVLAGVAQRQRVGAEGDGAVAGQADDRSAAVGQPG